jgi:hypothetical protein
VVVLELCNYLFDFFAGILLEVEVFILEEELYFAEILAGHDFLRL